jgi:low temperature requirement protein LtrA
MRIALVAQWVRAGIEHPAGRATAFRYAIGISVVQAGWLLRLLLAETGVLPAASLVPIFAGLVVLELAVPPWAERTRSTNWHAHHIAERYGLFTIILLGESVLAASTGVQGGFSGGGLGVPLVTIAFGGLVLLFALWWLYFLEPSASGLADNRDGSYLWGYGHYGIFASLAALGAGLEVAVEQTGHHLQVSAMVVAYAVAIPVGAFLVLLWAVHAPIVPRPVIRPAVILFAALVVLLLPTTVGWAGLSAVVAAIAGTVAVVVAVTIVAPSEGPRAGHPREDG